MAKRAQGSAPQRILIIRPSALGDVCRTVPVLATLRRAWPDARIDWVVQDTFVDAIAAHPGLDEAIPFPRSRFARWWRQPRAAAEMLRWFADLRRRRYDLVLDCQGLGRSGLIAFATGARRRVGMRGAREFAWLGYNVRHAVPTVAHTVDRMLALAAAEGIEVVHDMRLHVSEEDQAWWRVRRRELGLEPGRYALLAPTSRWLSKRWPAARFAALGPPLRAHGFTRMVVIGAPGEETQVHELLGADGGGEPPATELINLVGRLTVGQLMAVIRQAGLAVGNDSAPLHMAVGFDVPCVALFGPTDPDVVGPYRRREAVVRRYDPVPGQKRVSFKSASLGDALMRLIEVEHVAERMQHVLGAAAEEPGDAAPVGETSS